MVVVRKVLTVATAAALSVMFAFGACGGDETSTTPTTTAAGGSSANGGGGSAATGGAATGGAATGGAATGGAGGACIGHGCECSDCQGEGGCSASSQGLTCGVECCLHSGAQQACVMIEGTIQCIPLPEACAADETCDCVLEQPDMVYCYWVGDP